MDELGMHVLLSKHCVGLCIQCIVSVCVCMRRLGLTCVYTQATEKMWDIFVPPIRGCAHVKVYLKLFNEAWSNGSWSCRHTSLTLFHWRRWGRRERGAVSSDLATMENRQVQCIWTKAHLVFDVLRLIYLKLRPEDVCHRSGKDTSLFPKPCCLICLCVRVALLAQLNCLLCLFLSFLSGSL